LIVALFYKGAITYLPVLLEATKEYMLIVAGFENSDRSLPAWNKAARKLVELHKKTHQSIASTQSTKVVGSAVRVVQTKQLKDFHGLLKLSAERFDPAVISDLPNLPEWNTWTSQEQGHEEGGGGLAAEEGGGGLAGGSGLTSGEEEEELLNEFPLTQRTQRPPARGDSEDRVDVSTAPPPLFPHLTTNMSTLPHQRCDSASSEGHEDEEEEYISATPSPSASPSGSCGEESDPEKEVPLFLPVPLPTLRTDY
jgi:hypothetical protein